MQKKRIFTWLTLMSAVVCLAAFAWAENSVNTAPARSIPVTNSTDLRTAVANEGSGDIIVISGNIDMGAKSLSIPAGRKVTLSLDLGSRLDFSGSNQRVSAWEDYVGIYNLGNLTIAGSGEIVMSGSEVATYSLIYCNGNASLNVMGGILTVGSPYRAFAIHNNAESAYVTVTGGRITANGGTGTESAAIFNDAESASITVTGGSLTVNNNSTSYTFSNTILNWGANSSITVTGGSLTANSDYYNVAIYNGGENSSVTVMGGSLTANGGYSNCAVSNSGENSSVTVMGGSLTASGDGNVAIYNDGENSSVTVTGGSLTASGGYSSYAISNSGGNSSVTVMGGSLTAASGDYGSYAVSNSGENSSVTVMGGSITASGSNACYAIFSDKAAVVTVLSGNFVGDLSGMMETTTLYGGTYKGCARTGFKGLIAPGCTWKDVDGNIRITNCSSLSLGGAKFKGGEYRCYVAPVIGETITLSADLTSGDESIAILSFDAIDAGLPRSLDVTTSSADKKITITNNGLTEGTYRVTIMAEGANSRKACRTLNITVSDVPEPEDVNVSIPEDLKSALGYIWIDSVTLSDDYSGTVTEEITIASDKTLYLNDQRLAFADNGVIIVPEGTSLDIIGPGTVSKDGGPIFEVHGSLTITGGKYYAANCLYFTQKATPAENMALLNAEEEEGKITIAEGTHFWFSDNEEARETFIADNLESDGLTLVETEEPGWYKVTASGKGGSSSSGGCNAGFAALALMGLAFVPTRKKK